MKHLHVKFMNIYFKNNWIKTHIHLYACFNMSRYVLNEMLSEVGCKLYTEPVLCNT